MEKNCDVKNVLLQNATNLFVIKDIKDVQKGVRFVDSNVANYCTFFGFEKNKRKNRSSYCSSKTDWFNEFGYDYEEEDDV